MPLNDQILNVAADAMRAQITHLSLHSALPDATGSNQSTAPRVAAGWPAASGGDLTIGSKLFTGGGANNPCLYIGFWNASSGGTFWGYQALSGDQVFSTTGEYTVNSVTINGSS